MNLVVGELVTYEEDETLVKKMEQTRKDGKDVP